MCINYLQSDIVKSLPFKYSMFVIEYVIIMKRLKIIERINIITTVGKSYFGTYRVAKVRHPYIFK
jgi:hypothetical protein